VLAILLLASTAACSQSAQTKVQNAAQAGASDAYVALAVKAKLAGVDVNSATAVHAAAKTGTVTLTGEASSQAERRAYVAAAGSVDGVASVVDRLSVNPRMRGIRGQADDAAIAAKVAAAVAGQAGVNVFQIKPTVRDGVVTLSGTVATRQIKETILSTARNVPGVTSVVDRIRLQGS